jgi:hypothetical protein
VEVSRRPYVLWSTPGVAHLGRHSDGIAERAELSEGRLSMVQNIIGVASVLGTAAGYVFIVRVLLNIRRGHYEKW